MVLYAPKTAVQEVSSLILRVFFSNPALVTELRCGLRPLHDGDSLPILRDPVCLSLGNVYACILPLMEGGEVRVEQRPDGLALAFTGIAGTPRHMTRKELKLFRFGFVFSALSREECGSFDNFCHTMTEYALQDQLIANHHTRFAYERRVSFRGGGDTLECAYSPVTEGIRILRANGKSLL